MSPFVAMGCNPTACNSWENFLQKKTKQTKIQTLETETLKLETPHIVQRGLFPPVDRQSLKACFNHKWTRINTD